MKIRERCRLQISMRSGKDSNSYEFHVSHKKLILHGFAMVWFNFGRGKDQTWEDAEIHEETKTSTLNPPAGPSQFRILALKVQKRLEREYIQPQGRVKKPVQSLQKEKGHPRDDIPLEIGGSVDQGRGPSQLSHLIKSFFRHKDTACTLLTSGEKAIPEFGRCICVWTVKIGKETISPDCDTCRRDDINVGGTGLHCLLLILTASHKAPPCNE